MSSYVRLTGDQKITDAPCFLHSLTITTEGSGPGKIQVYDARGAESGYMVASLLCPSNQTAQYRWQGLRLDRGLYIDFIEKADYVTVEWEPIKKHKG